MKPKKSPLAMVSTGEDKRQRMRRILWISLLVLVVASIIWVYVKLNQPTTFSITTVKIEGSYPHLPTKEFETQIAPYATGGFFEINVEQIKAQALTFPWVYQADVRKVFPDKLVIVITEQTPVAQWNNNALLNGEGDLFAPPLATFPQNLPQLFGPDDQASMMLASFERMNQILQPINLHITRIDLSMRRAWTIQLDNNMELSLGRSFIWQRLKRFVDMYPKVFVDTKRKAKSVDLRYPNGFSVQWQK